MNFRLICTFVQKVRLNTMNQYFCCTCMAIWSLFFPPSTSVWSQQQSDNRLFNMIFVEGGSFEMGNKRGYVMEQPVHTVLLHDFYVDKYEVTSIDYKIFCAATNRKIPTAPPWGWIDNNPIVNITWDDAHAYAAWVGKRLLTEAEWEYAARGGKLSKGYKYSGSDALDEVGWFIENSGKKIHLVGMKKPNELGVYDMTGNAIEWCEDWYDDLFYRKTTKDNPLGPNQGTTRILRGGSYTGDIDDCRVTKRSHREPKRTQIRIGFRCALSK